jgi:SAM-dependent methyltransferase
MPRLASSADAIAMFAPFAHSYDVVYHAHRRDVTQFVDIAAPVPGECVLDLGTGSAWVLLEAKRRVGSGTCVGVDVCGELLKNIAKTNIRDAGFGLPRSTDNPNKLVRLARGDITDPQAFGTLRSWLPQGRTGFDVITALWVFDMLPWDKRDESLRLWKSWLQPGGRIVVHLNLEVPHPDFPAAEGTECPSLWTLEAPVATYIVNGTEARGRGAVTQQKCAPDFLWDECQAQVRRQAARCGLDIISMTNFHAENEGVAPVFKDESAEHLGGARKAWAAQHPGGGEMTTLFLTKYLQGRIQALPAEMQAQHSGPVFIGHKNVAVIAVLRVAA